MNGTITRRPKRNGSVSWGYSFFAGRTDTGKRLQITKSGFGTKREASEALRAAIAEHEAAQSSGPAALEAPPAFAAFFERWLAEYASRRCAPITLQRYRQLGDYALRKFGDVALDKLTPMLIETSLNALHDTGGHNGKPLQAITVRNIGFVVHGALKTAVRWGLIPVNPMDRVELPKAVKTPRKVLDREGVNQLLTAARGTRLFPLLVVAAATGCRRGELLALQWSDIDWKSGILNVTKSLEETDAGVRVKSTKSGKPRRFAIPEGALEVLREHRAQQEADREMFGPDYEQNDLVFCRPEGAYYRPDKVGARVTELARKAGLPGVGLHSLRHSHASELLSKGAPIPTVAKRLGHANPNVTLSIYAHALEADELAAAKIWNDAMADVIDMNGRTALTPRNRSCLAKTRAKS